MIQCGGVRLVVDDFKRERDRPKKVLGFQHMTLVGRCGGHKLQ